MRGDEVRITERQRARMVLLLAPFEGLTSKPPALPGVRDFSTKWSTHTDTKSWVTIVGRFIVVSCEEMHIDIVCTY